MVAVSDAIAYDTIRYVIECGVNSVRSYSKENFGLYRLGHMASGESRGGFSL